MNSETAGLARTWKFYASAAIACVVIALPSVALAQSSVGAAVCPIIAKLLPEVRTYKPAGARAQLVTAVAEKFEYDAVKLRQVRAEVDAATTVACPKEREAMLGVLKMKTLAEALS